MSNLKAIWRVISALLLIGEFIYCIGISTQFADVILENLRIGGVYNLRTLKNLPYVVKNNSDSPQKIQVVVEKPREDKLVSGYEQIPDESWIKVIPNEFTLGPKENGYADIIINIPNEEKYNNKHYQVSIVARTIPEYSGGGIAFGVELESRLRFSVGTIGPASLQELKRKRKLLTLNFDVKPENIYLTEVPIGIPFKVPMDKTLSISNRDIHPITLKFKTIPYEPRFSISPGYEPAPEDASLKFKRKKIKVKGKTLKDVDMVVHIPENEEYRNKKYVFIVKAELVGYDVPVELYSRVYVTTK